MARHQKELTKKQKIIISISSAIAAAAAAIGATFLVVLLVQNPPAFVFNTTVNPPISGLSTLSTYDYVHVPEATIIVTTEKVDKIIDAEKQVEMTEANKIVVKNYKVDSSKLIKRKAKIPVDFLAQNPELPMGSEITSLTTVLNFYGYDVSKTEMSDTYLDKTKNKIGDFWEVYVGDPAKNGFGCYAKPIVNAANRYLESQNKAYTAVDYSGAKFEDLLSLVESNTPVIIWGTTYNEGTKTLQEPYSSVKWNINNKDITWISPEHCMVLIGYDLDKNVAIVSDPLRGIVEYDLDTVKARYLALYSQCVVLERAPIITGVENGATYYTTQCVSVSNHNIAHVTVNGQDSPNVFLIDGNIENTYRIVVTEQNGNATEYVVYTKPIWALFDSLQGKNEYNVTADDRSTIESIKNTALSAETDYSPREETNELELVITACDLMLSNIDAAADKLESIKEKAKNFEGKGLTISDSTELIRLSEDISALLANENLSAKQIQELNDIRTKCNQWLANLQSE